MEVIILPSIEAVAEYGAALVAYEIKRKPNCVLGLATGRTPVGLYRRLINMHKAGKLSFAKVTTFNLDEYVGLPQSHPATYRTFMIENFFKHIDIPLNQTNIPNSETKDVETECASYETKIKQTGGIDLQILGIGINGHIGFNEPSSSLASRTRTKTLTPETRVQNAEFFSPPESMPHHVITMGVGTILESRRALLLATGEMKAKAIFETVEGPITASVTSSALQLHPRCTLVIDEAAASRLQHRGYYKFTFENRPLFQRVEDLIHKS